MSSKRRIQSILCLAFILLATSVFAITDEEIFRNFPFTVVNPGARSGAMGGAFIGLADDATAAAANPAGLTILTKPEVSFEYRNSAFDETRLNSFGVISPPGINLLVNTSNEIKDQNTLSFLSVVYPTKSWTVGFSRQQATKSDFNITEDILFNNSDLGVVQVTANGTASQDIAYWNFSLASKLNDHFSLGVTLNYAQLDWQTDVKNFFAFQGLSVLGTETTIDATDSSFGFSAGALIKANDHFSMGFVYKKNPKFEVPETEKSDFLPSANRTFTNTLNVPDTFGGGISYKPNDNLTLVADVVYIKYGDLMDNFQAGHNIFTLGYTNEDLQYDVKNETEFHVGTEFVVFLGSVPVALREGYYFRPANSLLLVGTPGALPADKVLLPALFTSREDEHHFTFGNGFVFGPHFQVDWAVDLSNLQDDFVLSSVIRF